MGRIEADIALESWLFGFWPCSALFRTGAVYPSGPNLTSFQFLTGVEQLGSNQHKLTFIPPNLRTLGDAYGVTPAPPIQVHLPSDGTG